MSDFNQAIALCNKHPAERCVIKTTADVGMMVRSEFRKFVKEYCFMHDLDLDLQEEKGFFSSTFFIKASGLSKACSNFVQFLASLQ